MTAPLVLDQGWVVSESGGGAELTPGWDAAEIYERVVRANRSAVFVLSDADDAVRRLTAHVGSLAVTVTGGGRNSRPVWRVQLRDGDAGARVAVVLVGNDVAGMGGPWRGMTPREVLRAFVAFRNLCGVDWASSIGQTAERLILATHPRGRGGTRLDPSPVTPEAIAGSTLELPFASWRRPLTEAESGAGFVHEFDANAQYLAAWQAAELGHGTPTLSTSGRFDPARVGFWHYPGGLDGMPNLRPLLPAPWCAGGEREWFSTATVVRMLEVSDGLDVPAPDQAWLWPQKSRFLRVAGERLRDARAEGRAIAAKLDAEVDGLVDDAAVDEWAGRKVAAAAVVEAVKSLYTVQTGRFGMGARDAGSGWARPDWGHTVRATARVNLHRRLWRLGAAPFAIQTDGLFFLDDEPDPVAFAKRIGLPLGAGLGEFRHEATVKALAIDDGVLMHGTAGSLNSAIAEVME